ncbi:hypothetical protein P3T23_001995 [Paraburkholderia sp. GAS448]|jgi:hypothetical protein|uniref:hypothetical protein n=1 Tax=Paraburkholderia sp. GAS448 TaxID=3035136 RepID=UPI003D1CC765
MEHDASKQAAGSFHMPVRDWLHDYQKAWLKHRPVSATASDPKDTVQPKPDRPEAGHRTTVNRNANLKMVYNEEAATLPRSARQY